MIQFMGQPKTDFFVRFKADKSLKCLQYNITLFTTETGAFRLICFFGFTVDIGSSQQTERMSNT